MTVKRATTIDKQIEILESRGCVVEDREKAKEVLLDIGYYRFCSYLFPFEQSYPSKVSRNHMYKAGTTFEDGLALYYFDFDLRKLLLKYLFRIEVNIRTYITYFVSNYYYAEPCWFVKSSFMSAKYINDFDGKFYNKLKRDNLVIKEHHAKYPSHKHAPAWKTIEQMTFGNVQTLYENILDQAIRQKIGLHYGVNKIDVFEQYVDAIRRIRNHCAHGSIIFDMKLPMPMQHGPAGAFTIFTGSNIVGIIEVMKFFLKQISKHRYDDFCKDIQTLLCGVDNPQAVWVLQNISGFSIERNNWMIRKYYRFKRRKFY